ncbi:MAG: fused MFS/spermidine synthase [Bacteroidales bacterium]|nr:fused MFS/spermidine synthase [Bacteroidales bacterium]
MIQGPYHFIPIGILLTVSYLLSLLAVKMQIIRKARHKKFWNLLLAAAFFTTAIIGIILAAKVNYKWNAPWFDTLIQWHVDIGTVMIFIVFFHFSWNFRYFKNICKPEGYKVGAEEWNHDLHLSKAQLRLFFILLGAVSIIIQLVLIREFLKSLHGNELIIGLMLSVWMMLTALGAWVGSAYRVKMSKDAVLRALAILTILPLVIYLVNILVIRFLFLPGYEPGLLESFLIIVLQLLPITLLSGILFGYVAKSNRNILSLSSFYMLDSLGSLAGGILFGGILVFFLENLQVLAILYFTATIIVVFILKLQLRIIPRIMLLGISVVLTLFVMIPKGKNLIESLRYRKESVLEFQDTPYSNLTYTSKEGQVTLYSNATPFLSSYDVIQAEESVHYTVLQHPNPTHFLMISGGLYGAIDEIIKYNPERIDYCESDPSILKLNKKYFDIPEHQAVNIINRDGRNWLQMNDNPYDIILSLPGEPYTLGLNRFYTTEYFSLVKQNLRKNGVFGLKINPSGNYISEESLQLNSAVYHSLSRVFKHVLIIPGASNYFIASDTLLSIDIPSLYNGANFSNRYVNTDYLDKTQLEFESSLLHEEINKAPVELNSDLWPRIFYLSITNWLSKSGGNLRIAGILGIIGFLIILLLFKKESAGVYVGGFTGAGIQILLIMALQSFYGLAYLATPLMVTVFMAGIVLGVAYCKRLWHGFSLSKFTILLWIMALFCGGALILFRYPGLFAERFVGLTLLFIMNMIPGILIGFLYSMAVNLSHDHRIHVAGKLFGADLAGAALGTFITSIIILPLLGVTYTLILFSGINIAAGLYLLFRWGNRN